MNAEWELAMDRASCRLQGDNTVCLSSRPARSAQESSKHWVMSAC